MKPNEALEILAEILRRTPINRAEAFAVQTALQALAAATAPKQE